MTTRSEYLADLDTAAETIGRSLSGLRAERAARLDQARVCPLHEIEALHDAEDRFDYLVLGLLEAHGLSDLLIGHRLPAADLTGTAILEVGGTLLAKVDQQLAAMVTRQTQRRTA
ncbi:MAG: hypothetical protein H6979_02880 [Chromatiales bacterium]|nr:hypothetical protein [Chromatiales bacterium]